MIDDSASSVRCCPFWWGEVRWDTGYMRKVRWVILAAAGVGLVVSLLSWIC
jgi:hypothetical protein